MNHFFADAGQVKDGYIIIRGSDVAHIKNVLRMKAGEKILVSDGQGTDYICGIESLGDEVTCRIITERQCASEPVVRFFLFQGLPKADKFEHIIQKSVELGVYEIIPVAMGRSVVKYDDKKAGAKTERWQKIAESAAKQSKRGIIPEVKGIMGFREALKYAADITENGLGLIPYEEATDMKLTRETISGIKPGMNVAIFVGPEGGIEEAEIEAARSAGMVPITLGKRILRTETAPLMLLSVLTFAMEE